ncbi:uncharacterized protein A4U43_C09F4280 [Asparagus officinalis]|uniref:Uncharacterized protein n=1 Tax=Asparagus officinalis TaxID=4686 RepID=A0A5P1EA19_ASPOF|nr:uncharacterized protein A4U43_C09F4280 [Asparagus officinalis]
MARSLSRHLPFIFPHRERIGAAEDLVFLVQALKDESKSSSAKSVTPAKPRRGRRRRRRFTPSTSTTLRLPRGRGSRRRRRSRCSRSARSRGRQLVLVGGWDPKTLDPVAETRILDLATMAWREGRADGRRRGRSSPAPLFGAESLRGGGTRSKNALRSAEAYDVAADEWCRAYRRMSEERDKAQVVIPWGLEVHGGEAGTGPRAREVQPTSAEVYRRG